MQAHSLRRFGLFTVTDFPTRLFALKVRRALLYEGLRAFEMIFRREHQVLAVALVVEKIWQVEIQADAQSFLGQALC
jgi:hypothetical protein